MFSDETQFERDIIIELDGLVSCIKDCIQRDEDGEQQPAEATLKRPYARDDSPDIFDKYQRTLEAQMRKKRKQDKGGQ